MEKSFRNLDNLLVHRLRYVDPETLGPYSGPVYSLHEDGRTVKSRTFSSIGSRALLSQTHLHTSAYLPRSRQMTLQAAWKLLADLTSGSRSRRTEPTGEAPQAEPRQLLSLLSTLRSLRQRQAGEPSLRGDTSQPPRLERSSSSVHSTRTS